MTNPNSLTIVESQIIEMFGKRLIVVPDSDKRNCNACVLYDLCELCDSTELESPCYRGKGRIPIHFELAKSK